MQKECVMGIRVPHIYTLRILHFSICAFLKIQYSKMPLALYVIRFWHFNNELIYLKQNTLQATVISSVKTYSYTIYSQEIIFIWHFAGLPSFYNNSLSLTPSWKLNYWSRKELFSLFDAHCLYLTHFFFADTMICEWSLQMGRASMSCFKLAFICIH